VGGGKEKKIGVVLRERGGKAIASKRNAFSPGGERNLDSVRMKRERTGASQYA